MKTRTVVHIALNAKNERVGSLGLCGGMLVPFRSVSFNDLKSTRASEFQLMDFGVERSVGDWKARMKRTRDAARFQRVTLIGESK